MRKHYSLIAAAALTVAGFSYHQALADDMGNPKSDQPGVTDQHDMATTQPSGEIVADNDAKAVRDSLGKITNTALTKNGFSDISQYVQTRHGMAHSDRPGAQGVPRPGQAPSVPGEGGLKPNNTPPAAGDNTAGGVATPSQPGQPFKNYDDLNNAVAQLQQDWKDKYNSDFNITGDNEAMVFNDSVRIYKGDIGESARTAGERVTPADPADNNMPKADADHDADRDADHKADADRMVTVYIPASQDMKAVKLRLTNAGEAGTYRILVPHGTDQQVIHDCLLKQLNALHDQRNNWPSDQTQAYRVVSNHVLGAFSEACRMGMRDRDMNRGNDNPGADNNNRDKTTPDNRDLNDRNNNRDQNTPGAPGHSVTGTDAGPNNPNR